MPVEDQGTFPDRYRIIPRALVFATRAEAVLLLKGAPTKRLWPNLYNGVGGHIEAGEDPLSAARREFHEETGLNLAEAHLAAVVMIDTRQPTGIGMFVFAGAAAPGEPRAGDEGSLEWVAFDRIPSLPLVEDLPELLPRVLAWQAGQPPIFGRYFYNETEKLMIEFANP
ncbi:MAG: NUDIX domain-containing protein [Chloroflexi bacterium]|nr:NUDIX domain-containing protein [Chloroflexota bacterium]